MTSQRSKRERLSYEIALSLFVLLLITVNARSQEKSTYKPGVILSVVDHQPAEDEAGKKLYDVSVRVGTIIYTVLYTAPAGSNSVEYSAGTDRPVKIEKDKMTVVGLRGDSVQLPIIGRKEVRKPE